MLVPACPNDGVTDVTTGVTDGVYVIAFESVTEYVSGNV